MENQTTPCKALVLAGGGARGSYQVGVWLFCCWQSWDILPKNREILKKINFSKKCFGISTPEQAARMAEKCDGVIVGSAIVKLCGQYGKDCVPYVEKYVKSIKDAIRV